ncbi:MAG TPA: cobalamin biosynthesis protein CobT [Bradyrhizobium sp.]|nr:cobalamin biosynthesis protein CobT [Bradyrhizobium sp.]
MGSGAARQPAKVEAKLPEYRAYTTRFDREVSARELDTVLGPLSPSARLAVDEAWHALETGLLPWKTRLLVTAAEVSAKLRTELTDGACADTAVALLIDQSGSMRGQKMLFATASVDVTQEFLATLGITCEVLGFTTSRWRGGRSRSRWKWRFRPSHPGRLNDLLHIVYRSADDTRASTGSWHLRQMLRPDLTKENIDGEALHWAAQRLRRLPQRSKHLIIVSDGAPVDDSTILANGLGYLGDHLQTVVKSITDAGDIRLAAIRIGQVEANPYPVSIDVKAPDALGHALIELLSRVLPYSSKPAAR